MSLLPNSAGSSDGRQGTILDTLGINKINLDTLHHDVRRNLTKVDPRLTEDLKNIVLLIKEEKNVLTTLQNLSNERKEVSKRLFIWGKEDNGEDIADITEKIANLMAKISDVEAVLCEKHEHYRTALKEIRDAEQRLHVPRERRRKITEEISRLTKSHPTSPRIQELQNDLQRINTDTTMDELEVGNIKRQKLKEALATLLDSIFESAEKIAVISGFGWYILEQLDTTPAKGGEPRTKYDGFKATQEVIHECQIALHRWQPPAVDLKELLPSLTNTAPALLSAQKAEYEARINKLQATMTSQREASDTQIAEILDKLETQRQAFEKQVAELTTAITSQQEGYETQEQAFEKKVNELTAEVTAQREGREAQAKEHEQAFEAKVAELTAAIASQKEDYEAQIKDLLDSLSSQKHGYEVQLNDLANVQKQKISELENEKQKYEVQLHERESQISKLHSEINSVAAEKGKLEQVVKVMEDTLKSKTTTLEQKEEKIGRLEEDISGIKTQLAGLKLTPATAISTPASREGAAPVSNPRSDAGPTMAGPQYQQPPYGQSAYYQQQYYQQQPQQYYPQQQYYQQPPANPSQVAYGYQPQAPYGGQPSQSQSQPQPGAFVGGFNFGVPDEAPPAYDGPPANNDEKKREKN